MDGEFDGLVTKLNQKVLIAATAPASPIAGMLWLDSTNKLLKEYRNSEWIVHAPVHVGTTAPTTCQEGDLWFDSTNHILYVYQSSTVSQRIITTSNYGTLGMIHTSAGVGTAPNNLGQGTANQFLRSNGVGSAPEFVTFDYSTYGTGILPVTKGGTGVTSTQIGTSGAISSGDNTVNFASSFANTNYILIVTPVRSDGGDVGGVIKSKAVGSFVWTAAGGSHNYINYLAIGTGA
jgi:hypothetical protein